jgi:hypothetical protein
MQKKGHFSVMGIAQIKMICGILKGIIYFKGNEKVTINGLMDYMVSLHFLDFIYWDVLDNGPLYCITFWSREEKDI